MSKDEVPLLSHRHLLKVMHQGIRKMPSAPKSAHAYYEKDELTENEEFLQIILKF